MRTAFKPPMHTLMNMKSTERKSVLTHLENPDFKDLLFTYVDVTESREKIAA